MKAGYGDKYIDLLIEGGNGWGGDGKDPHRVLLYSSDMEHIICLTAKQAKELAEWIQVAVEQYPEDFEDDDTEEDDTVVFQSSLDCQVDTQRFFNMRKEYTEGKCTREEMLAFLRYLHETYPEVYTSDPDKFLKEEKK